MNELLFRVKQNQVRMLQMRGYKIGEEERLLDASFEDVKKLYDDWAQEEQRSVRDLLRGIYNKGEEICFVSYVESRGKQVLIDPVRKYIAQYQENRATKGIIITQQPLSSESATVLSNTTANSVQHFLEAELAYLPFKHYLQPVYEIIPKNEADKWYEANRIKPSQLPFILRKDPVIKFLGVPPGTLVRERHRALGVEMFTREYITYSLVV